MLAYLRFYVKYVTWLTVRFCVVLGNLQSLCILKVDQNQLFTLTPEIGKYVAFQKLTRWRNCYVSLKKNVWFSNWFFSRRKFSDENNRVSSFDLEIGALGGQRVRTNLCIPNVLLWMAILLALRCLSKQSICLIFDLFPLLFTFLICSWWFFWTANCKCWIILFEGFTNMVICGN